MPHAPSERWDVGAGLPTMGMAEEIVLAFNWQQHHLIALASSTAPARPLHGHGMAGNAPLPSSLLASLPGHQPSGSVLSCSGEERVTPLGALHAPLHSISVIRLISKSVSPACTSPWLWGAQGGEDSSGVPIWVFPPFSPHKGLEEMLIYICGAWVAAPRSEEIGPCSGGKLPLGPADVWGGGWSRRLWGRQGRLRGKRR